MTTLPPGRDRSNYSMRSVDDEILRAVRETSPSGFESIVGRVRAGSLGERYDDHVITSRVWLLQRRGYLRERPDGTVELTESGHRETA